MSPPYGAILQVTGATCIVIISRALLTGFVFTPCGVRLLPKTEQQRGFTRQLQRFCEAAWRATGYSTLLLIGLSALHDQPWFTDSRQFWRGWPDQAIPWKVKLYYTAEMGFYCEALLSLLLWEERRSDFPVMLTHHFVTLTLISLSALWRYIRVGSMVMVLHDPSDVFLEVAKLLNYIGAETPSIICFAGLIVSWLVLRLILLPFWVIRSTGWGVIRELGQIPPWGYLFNVLLSSLVVMHLYWFTLILKVAIQQLRSGKAEDIREDKAHDE
eukprot:jgi/Botrbrau1/4384/Bobra.105_2s0030.1